MTLFQNAGQLWNHADFWKSLASTPTAPSEALATAIDRDFGDTRRSPSNLSTSARSTLARAGSGSSPMRAGTYRYQQHMTRPRPGWKPTRRRCRSAICGNMPIISTSATTGRSSSPTLPQPTSIGPLHRTYIVQATRPYGAIHPRSVDRSTKRKLVRWK
jgi:hypothetical protein